MNNNNYEQRVVKYYQELNEWYLKNILGIVQSVVNARKRTILSAFSCIVQEIDAKKRKVWVSPLCQLRSRHGFYAAIYPTLANMDNEFLNYFRMSQSKFHTLLGIVGPKITKSKCARNTISPMERLCLTLRYSSKHNIDKPRVKNNNIL